jgi:hypothetical protein
MKDLIIAMSESSSLSWRAMAWMGRNCQYQVRKKNLTSKHGQMHRQLSPG